MKPNYKRGIATTAAIVIMSTSMAASSAAINEARKAEARTLAAQNGQPCEYQVRVKDGYQCMNEEQKKAHDAIPMSSGEKTLAYMVFGVLALVFIMVGYMIFDIIFN